MPDKEYRPRQRITDGLHPGIYLALAGFGLWYAFSAWAFGGGAYTDYLLAVVTGLIAIAILIPLGMWRIWRNHAHRRDSDEPFRFWAAGDLRIWQDRMRARSAAIEILLPVAAVAIGLLILATINHFTPR
ncbi:MAG: hypothetical protein ACOZAM_07020 [Pseudomonadota bacterium]